MRRRGVKLTEYKWPVVFLHNTGVLDCYVQQITNDSLSFSYHVKTHSSLNPLKSSPLRSYQLLIMENNKVSILTPLY